MVVSNSRRRTRQVLEVVPCTRRHHINHRLQRHRPLARRYPQQHHSPACRRLLHRVCSSTRCSIHCRAPAKTCSLRTKRELHNLSRSIHHSRALAHCSRMVGRRSYRRSATLIRPPQPRRRRRRSLPSSTRTNQRYQSEPTTLLPRAQAWGRSGCINSTHNQRYNPSTVTILISAPTRAPIHPPSIQPSITTCLFEL